MRTLSRGSIGMDVVRMRGEFGSIVVGPRPLSQPSRLDALTMRILLVDGAESRRDIEDFFRANGIEMSTAEDFQTLQARLAADRFDLILLEMRAGSESGLDLLRAIRQQGNVPVIVTAYQSGDDADRIAALELGADDYLTKPVGLRELLARIRTILRRTEVRSEPAPAGKVRFRDWELDRRLRILRDPGGEIVKLTKGEYALLTAFVGQPGKTLSREHLLNATRVHEDIFDRSIDVQILRLRRKLDRDPAARRMIVTIRGLGYLFDAIVETVS